MCTPFGVQSLPGCITSIDSNLRSMEREELHVRKANAALKRKRNWCISPACRLPSEVLAIIFMFAAAYAPVYGAPEEYVKLHLQQVCSCWRHIALDVCPIWANASLITISSGASESKQASSRIGLWGGHGRSSGELQLPTRQPDMEDAQLIQATLDMIAPYMKQLTKIDLAFDHVEQIQQLIEPYLKKVAPGSLAELTLSVNRVALIFPDTHPHVRECFSHLLGRLERLTLSSVGLDWTSVKFARLATMSLSDLPLVCCPTLAQLVRILSTCPGLRILRLERITIPDSLDLPVPEPVQLEHLSSLSLRDVDFARVLSIISSGRGRLSISLHGDIDITSTLESLRSLASRALIDVLSFSLLETRSNIALAQLLSFANCIPDHHRVGLFDMILRNSELDAVAVNSITQNNQLLPSAWPRHPRRVEIVVWRSTIRTTPMAFLNAISIFSWDELKLIECDHSFTTQGEDGPNEELELINCTSGFGFQLINLVPSRTVYID
ncbi:hypothetical protein BDV93DRAFT_563247 [Ceratobasidium sp. AG-I]|nr:hypothetical protein BDV93DRAFT_563247 [Ceratobasidium sp. AG-I]